MVPAPSREDIAARAYELFLARGGTHGHHTEDWARAERELCAPQAIVLVCAGDNKIGVIKELRDVTGLDLVKVRELVERAPHPIHQASNAAEAEQVRVRLAAVGATVELVQVSTAPVMKPASVPSAVFPKRT